MHCYYVHNALFLNCEWKSMLNEAIVDAFHLSGGGGEQYGCKVNMYFYKVIWVSWVTYSRLLFINNFIFLTSSWRHKVNYRLTILDKICVLFQAIYPLYFPVHCMLEEINCMHAVYYKWNWKIKETDHLSPPCLFFFTKSV